jgi:O-antigen ligase
MFTSAAGLGALLGFLIVFWSPLPGGARGPSVLLALLGLWFLARRRGGLFAVRAQRRFGLIFLLLWLPVLMSLPLSLHPRRSLDVAFALPLYYFAGLALIEALRADRPRRWLAVGVAVTLLFWMADGFMQYALGRDLFGIPLSDEGRVVGLFATNLRLGTFAAVLLPLALWLALERHAAFAAGAFALSAATVALAGARMNLVMLAVAAGSALFRLPRRWALAMLAAGGVAVVAAGAFSPAMQERAARALALTHSLDFETVNHALSGRGYLWETAARMALDRPLTGVGAGAFNAAYDRYSTRPGDIFASSHPQWEKPYHAHQMYISIAAESGFTGLAAIILAFALVVRWYVRADPARRAQAWPWLAGLLVAVFPINSQPVLYTHWWFAPLLLLLCAGLAALEGEATEGDAVAQRRWAERAAA